MSRIDIDGYFAAQRDAVELLAPPPGQYDEIRRRARRRRTARLTGAAASVAAVAIAVLAVGGAGGGGRQPVGPQPSGPVSGPPARPTGPIPTIPLGPLPAGFAPTSVSFVSTEHGYAMGTAPCAGHQVCTAVAESTDGGASWHAVGAPALPAQESGRAWADGIRFVDDRTGWIFGYGLWATTDGGRSWHQQSSDFVYDIEVAPATAYLVKDCEPGGFGCDGVAGEAVLTWSRQRGWRQGVGGHLSDNAASGYQLVVSGASAYAVGEWGAAAAAIRSADGGRTWRAMPVPCVPRGPLVASTAADPATTDALVPAPLYVMCADDRLWRSTDGGHTFHPTGRITAPPQLRAFSRTPPLPRALAAAGSTVVVAGELAGGPLSGALLVTRDAGRTWWVGAQAQLGFVDVRFTGRLGVALPSPELGEVFLSRDGGRTWTPYRFRRSG